MKKSILKSLSIMSIFLIFLTIFSGCKKANDGTITKVRLNEVTRSIFYAPMYAAISEGFFKEEGIEIDLQTGGGADGTVTNTQVIQAYKVYLQLLKIKGE